MTKSKYADKLKIGIPLLTKLKDGEIGRLQRASEDDRIPILEAWEDLMPMAARMKLIWKKGL